MESYTIPTSSWMFTSEFDREINKKKDSCWLIALLPDLNKYLYFYGATIAQLSGSEIFDVPARFLLKTYWKFIPEGLGSVRGVSTNIYIRNCF